MLEKGGDPVQMDLIRVSVDESASSQGAEHLTQECAHGHAADVRHGSRGYRALNVADNEVRLPFVTDTLKY